MTGDNRTKDRILDWTLEWNPLEKLVTLKKSGAWLTGSYQCQFLSCGEYTLMM